MPSKAEAQLWDALFSPRRHGSLVRNALQQLFSRWCRDQELTDAALYLPENSTHIRAVAMEGSAFPTDLESNLEDSAISRLYLPGGAILLYHGRGLIGDGSSLSPELLAALAVLVQFKEQNQQQKLRAMYQGVELVALYEVGLAIASILDLEVLGREILSRSVMLLEADLGALFELTGKELKLTSAMGNTPKSLPLENIFLEDGNLQSDVGSKLLPEAVDTIVARVANEGKITGLLVIGLDSNQDRSRAFRPKDKHTLSLFANQAAIALEKARLHQMELEKQRLDRDLDLAAEIQQELLPEGMPMITGFDVMGWTRAARAVGGDYYGFHELEDGRWGIVLGDVAGKGMSAALLVSTLDSALRVLLKNAPVDDSLMNRLNTHVLDSSTGSKYITMILSVLDPSTSELHYYNAGHNPGILIRNDGRVEKIAGTGMPVGLLPEFLCESAKIKFKPGDLVCLYSDGITECEEPSDEEYGMDRLVSLLLASYKQPLSDIINTIDEEMVKFAQHLPQGDDQTVLLIRCQ